MASTALPEKPAEEEEFVLPAMGEDRATFVVQQKGLLTIGVMMATLIQVLDSTIANVALPHMSTALGATTDTITWVLTSYIVAAAVAIPITGWLSDRLGSRNLFLISVAGFVGTSMLCGAATGLEEMVMFRVAQGMFAAFLNPLSQTVMLDINKPSEQPRAMSIWAMGIMVGPILGPMIGGWLTENYNWRWVFYINLPVGTAAFALLWLYLPSKPVRRRSFDLFGFSMLSLAIASFQIMLDRGQEQDWFNSWEIITEGLISLCAAWTFVVHMITGRNPMFDRALFKNRNLVTALGFMTVIGMLMMATMALLPPMLQQLFGYPVIDTGFMLMPRGVGVLISMYFASQWVQRGYDPRWPIGIGLAIAVVSLWQMTGWTLMMGARNVILSGFIQGLGMGLVFMPLNGTAFATLAPYQRTEGSSLLNLTRNIGSSVGISICSAMLSRNIQISHASIGSHVGGDLISSIDPIVTSMLGTTTQAVLGTINGIVTQQAAMIAYLDDFKLMMIASMCAIPLVFLLKPPRNTSHDPAHSVME